MLADENIIDTNLLCHICGEHKLKLFSNYQTLPRVTSDCSPWREGGRLGICDSCLCVQNPVDKSWQSETNEIYSRYQIYRQSAGSEQGVVSEGKVLVPRSEKIFQHIKDYLDLDKNGRLLDIGCANGELLRYFFTLAPHWKMVGFEIDDKRRDDVLSINGVEAFCSGSLDNINNRFDLITLIHVLEHLPNPKEWLKNINKLLNPGGHILIQLPDPKQNPFNLLVADHCSHFIMHDVIHLVKEAGYRVVISSDKWVAREFTLLITPRASLDNSFNLEQNHHPGCNKSFIQEGRTAKSSTAKASIYPQISLEWLHNIVNLVKLLPKDKPRGIWGTAIAATWIASVMGDVNFFVDEDRYRIGKKHMDRLIHSPDSAPKGSHIFIALTPEIAHSIVNRWSHLDISMHVPPDLIYNF